MSHHRAFAWDERETILFCALDYEARMVRRVSKLPKRRVIVSGPGADAMRRAVDAAPDGCDQALLLGFASGLDARVSSGGVYAIERVLAPDGRRFDPPWVVEQLERVTMVSVHEAVRTPAEKYALASRTGASIADLEGLAFATEAMRRRWRWGIVRAVFDGAAQTYPEGMETLVRPNGKTRLIRSLIWGILAQRSRPELTPLLEGAAMAAQKLGVVAKFATARAAEERPR